MLGPIPVGFRFFKDAIATYAGKHGFPAEVIAAVCWKESSFVASAFRFEPNFWNRYLKLNPLYRHLNPMRVSSSYGLMQVMYPRILEDKIADNDAWPPEDLFEPEKGLDVGCGFLAELMAWARTNGATGDYILTVALAAYNGGRGGNHPLKDKPIRNGVYARDVEARIPVMAKEYGV